MTGRVRLALEGGGVALTVIGGTLIAWGLPQAGTAYGSGIAALALRLVDRGLPLFDALPLCIDLGSRALLGAGAAALWVVARPQGWPTAMVAAGFGALSPVVGVALAEGHPEVLTVPLVAVALSAERRWVGFIATLLCGFFDAGIGVTTGLAAMVAGAGVWGLTGAILAGGLGFSAGWAASLDPSSLLAPLVQLQPGKLGPGLALLLGLAWVDAPRWRWAAAIGLLVSFGPVLQAFGAPLMVAGAGVPLPGLLAALLAPGAAGWGGALIVAIVAVVLGLRARPIVAGLLLLLLGAEAAAVGAPPPVKLAPSLLEADLKGGQGGVLHLPMEIADLDVAPAGIHTAYAYLSLHHGRPVANGQAPLSGPHVLFGEPGVVLAIDAALGDERYLLPPQVPGLTLSTLGISDILIHRSSFSAQALTVLDTVLPRWYGPPQRDLAGDVDRYTLRADAGPPPIPLPLRTAGDPQAVGWRTVTDTLRATGSGAGRQRNPPKP